jgi:tRNA-dihydrouridine synthase
VRADWDGIAAVRAAVQIPVLANGDVQCMADAQRLMAHTNTDGVLSAEPLLSDPALFSSTREPQVRWVRWVMCCPPFPLSCIRLEAACVCAVAGMMSLFLSLWQQLVSVSAQIRASCACWEVCTL